jgi:hypothetical protein
LGFGTFRMTCNGYGKELAVPGRKSQNATPPLKEEGAMKMRKMIRLQMLLGLGATLLLAGSARAQQEVDPTSFDVNPGTPVAEQAMVPVAQPIIQTANDTPRESLVSTALWSRQATHQETDMARMTLVGALLVVILIAGTALIVVYAKLATRRQRHMEPILSDSPYGPASGATTH